jgi:UDP-glucose/GDP-mannose dehydrogenase family, UDP binding domain
VLLLGVFYKAGVGVTRESPALKIIRLLRDLGADISYHDPHVPELQDLKVASAPLEESLETADWSASSPRTPRSTTARWSSAPRSSSTSAASPATSRPRTWCARS